MKTKILLALLLATPLYAMNGTHGTNDNNNDENNQPTPVINNEPVSFKKRFVQACRGEYMYLHDPSYVKPDELQEELLEEEQASYLKDFKYMALTPLVAGDYIINSPAYWIKSKHPNIAKKLYYKGYNDIHTHFAKSENMKGTVQLSNHLLKSGAIISLLNNLGYLIIHRLGWKNSFKIAFLKIGISLLCILEYMGCDYAVRNTAMSEKWHLITPVIVAFTFFILNYFSNKYVQKIKEGVVVQQVKKEHKSAIDKTSWGDIIFKLITPKTVDKKGNKKPNRKAIYKVLAKITLSIVGFFGTLLLATYRAK